MITLGVDPGTRNTGICVLHDGKDLIRRCIIRTPQGYGLESAIAWILLAIQDSPESRIDAACVEEVVWIGKPRKIVIPLSHVAGAITGFLVARGIPTYLVPPAMKKMAGRWPALGRGASEHERDAALLAKLAYFAEFAPGRLSRRGRLAVNKHKLSVRDNAHRSP